MCVCVICADDNNGIRSAGSNFHRIFSGPIHFPSFVDVALFLLLLSLATFGAARLRHRGFDFQIYSN